MEAARFSLLNYLFDKVSLDLTSVNPKQSFDINFEPKGVFDQEDKVYTLVFVFTASDHITNTEVINIRCNARYVFKNVNTIEEIPAFFYNNAIAILFPYIRAFVSTLTLQANIPPILLPTLNLSSLQDTLRENTSTK